MHNRAMEAMEKQGGEIAEKSAAVIKSAWTGLLGFCPNDLLGGYSYLSLLFSELIVT